MISSVRVCHVCKDCKDVWKPSIGEKRVARQEFNSPVDKCAMQVMTYICLVTVLFSQAVEQVECDRSENMFNLYLLKGFRVICDPIPTRLLPLKAIVSYISRTHDFEHNISAKRRGLYTSFI